MASSPQNHADAHTNVIVRWADASTPSSAPHASTFQLYPCLRRPPSAPPRAALSNASRSYTSKTPRCRSCRAAPWPPRQQGGGALPLEGGVGGARQLDGGAHVRREVSRVERIYAVSLARKVSLLDQFIDYIYFVWYWDDKDIAGRM